MTDDRAVPSALSLATLAERLVGCAPQIVGESSISVNHITEDSRQARPGTLFVARVGLKSDGTRYAPQALAAGASAVLCEAGSGVSVEPRLEVNDVRLAWGILAQGLFGDPSLELPVVGITGTNGKTTVASLVEQALRSQGKAVARSGTLGFFIGEEKLADSLTTPQPDQLAWGLAEAKRRGAFGAVLEVSSHALDQKRTAGVRFSVGAFTNLSQDHLDYHGTMEAYGAAKARLFRENTPAHQVIQVDDEFGRLLSAELSEAVTISTEGRDATIRALSSSFSRRGIEAVVESFGETVSFHSPLLGKHNLENLLVSWGILACLGLNLQEIVDGLGAATGVGGRLERCDTKEDDVAVVVDYAHTPDALSRALSALQELSFSEVVCVFGCGGDRDRSKRALMGEAAGALADKVVVTSDNPRSEKPKAIIDDIRPGLAAARGQIEEIPDRREAIERAVAWAEPGAVVLLAGKGHEDYQLAGDQVLSFDDRVEGREALEKRRAERKR